MKNIKILFIFGLILMLFITLTCSLIYLVTQQSLRLGANEILAQLAIETSLKLEAVQDINTTFPSEKIDVSRSLNAFVMVYDNNKNLIATSGMIGNDEPTYPKSVLDNVDVNRDNRVTWQPKSKLRFATVAIKYNKGYIVSARSLSETEKLINIIGKLVLSTWLACTVFTAIVLGVIYKFMNKTYTNKKYSN